MSEATPRERFQFSLKTLIWLMLIVIAYVAGWMSGRKSLEPSQPIPMFADYDQDGDVDIILDSMYLNQGDGTRISASWYQKTTHRIEFTEVSGENVHVQVSPCVGDENCDTLLA